MARAIHTTPTREAELSTWDPVPEWDGFPPEEGEAFSASHHRPALLGRMAAAIDVDGDIEAARFEFGGY